MRFCLVLLAIVALIAAISTTSAMVNFQIAHAARMRGIDTVHSGEERAISYPTMSKFIQWLSRPAAKELTLAEKVTVGKWIYNQKSSDYVFQKLGLHGGLDKVFTNPKLHLYAAYIDRFNKKNTRKQAAMIDMFSNTYQDDGAAKMIEMGKKSLNMETRKIASRLQQELVKKWVDNAESPDAVFELLKLDKAGFDLFRSPLVNTFYAFLKKDMAWGIEDRMLRTLIGKYGYAGLSKIFILGEPRIDLLGRLPMKLENRMVSKWLDNDISPDKVFELLQLNKGLDRLLTDPNLMMWQSYRVMFNSKRGVDATTTMHTITKFYKSQDVSAMLEKAKNVPATAKIATRWQHELKVQKLRGAKIKKEG